MKSDTAYRLFMTVVLDSLNLALAERKLCEQALRNGGTIVDAAALLGITRHALKRRMIKYDIAWPPRPELRTMPMGADLRVLPAE